MSSHLVFDSDDLLHNASVLARGVLHDIHLTESAESDPVLAWNRHCALEHASHILQGQSYDLSLRFTAPSGEYLAESENCDHEVCSSARQLDVADLYDMLASSGQKRYDCQALSDAGQAILVCGLSARTVEPTRSELRGMLISHVIFTFQELGDGQGRDRDWVEFCRSQMQNGSRSAFSNFRESYETYRAQAVEGASENSLAREPSGEAEGEHLSSPGAPGAKG
jgi:hypothetical protein